MVKRFIFRKITKISLRSKDVTSARQLFSKSRQIEAFDMKGKLVGHAIVKFPHGKKHALFENISVEKAERGKGVGTQLFARALRFVKKAQRDFLRTEQGIINERMIKIRAKLGSKFTSTTFDKGIDKTRLVSSRVARKLLRKTLSFKEKDKHFATIIKSTTSTSRIRFIRRRGRVIPIRIKKGNK